MSGNAAVVARLIEALEAQDLDTLVSMLDPEVEVTALKGSFRGRDQVRRWATKSQSGNLRSRIEVDETREVGEQFVAVDARRLWIWRENDELADEQRFGSLFRLRGGKIVAWRQDFGSIIEAIEAIPPGHHPRRSSRSAGRTSRSRQARTPRRPADP